MTPRRPRIPPACFPPPPRTRANEPGDLRALPAVTRLVVRPPNWLGDAVLALPALAAIRDAFPSADLTIAAPASVAALFREDTPVHPNRVVELPAGSRAATSSLARGPLRAGHPVSELISIGLAVLARRHSRAMGLCHVWPRAAAHAPEPARARGVAASGGLLPGTRHRAGHRVRSRSAAAAAPGRTERGRRCDAAGRARHRSRSTGRRACAWRGIRPGEAVAARAHG